MEDALNHIMRYQYHQWRLMFFVIFRPFSSFWYHTMWHSMEMEVALRSQWNDNWQLYFQYSTLFIFLLNDFPMKFHQRMMFRQGSTSRWIGSPTRGRRWIWTRTHLMPGTATCDSGVRWGSSKLFMLFLMWRRQRTGWWFGTWLWFFHILGIIIPVD